MKRTAKFSLVMLLAVLIAALAVTFTACNDNDEQNAAIQLSAPTIQIDGTVLSWAAVEHADRYLIFDGNDKIGETEDINFDVASAELSRCELELTVKAANSTQEYSISKSSNVVTAIIHTLGDEWIEDSPASCTAQAHHHKECKYCDFHMIEEDYGDLLPHQMGEWIEDSPASCTKLAHHHKECENCDYREDEDYGSLLPHELGDWIIDGENICNKDNTPVPRHKDCANCDYQLIDENYVVPHTWDEDTNQCDICGMDKPYEERDGKIYFGEYPQTQETDDGITATLAQMSGDRPSKGNAGKWMDYGYYVGIYSDIIGKRMPSKEEYMWYIDLEYGGAKYRGVYFTSYRLDKTTGNTYYGAWYQDGNGYYINTLYWFKWEPIEWRVLEKTDGEAFLMSNVILDSQQYYHDDNETRTIDGKTVYSNNYKESDIRAWLNGTFYNQAFDELDQSIIKTTLVDNSLSTTGYSSNSYVCENTNDKVFLLSYKDVINTSYGFNSIRGSYDTARQLKTTEYARSQGARISMDSSYRGNGDWWLRSPYYDSSYSAHFVEYRGFAYNFRDDVNYTHYGVVPALRITL